MGLSTIEKQEIITKFGTNEKDSGRLEVQIALLTKSILSLTEHMKINKHDFHSKRGLQQQVDYRKRLLVVLKSWDTKRYEVLIKELGLRK